MPTVVREVKQALSDGLCCVIGLQSTGEAAADRQDVSPCGSLYLSLLSIATLHFGDKCLTARIMCLLYLARNVLLKNALVVGKRSTCPKCIRCHKMSQAGNPKHPSFPNLTSCDGGVLSSGGC